MKKAMRKIFLAAATALLGFATLTGVGTIAKGQESQPVLANTASDKTANRAGFVSSSYELEVGRLLLGHLISVDGGHVIAESASATTGTNLLARKPGEARYMELTFTCGLMEAPFYQWLGAAIAKPENGLDGSVIFIGNGSALEKLAFTDAFIQEIVFPGVDKGSRDAARLSVTLLPTQTRKQLDLAGQDTLIADKQRWSASNFRLTIGGTEYAVTKVNKISFKQTVTREKVGNSEQSVPAGSSTSDLVIVLPEARANDFQKWQSDKSVKSGTLEYLNTENTAIFKLNFTGLALKSLTSVRTGTTASVQATMTIASLSVTK